MNNQSSIGTEKAFSPNLITKTDNSANQIGRVYQSVQISVLLRTLPQ